MNENFKKQIAGIDDIVEISKILRSSTQLLENISRYKKHPYDPQFSRDGYKVPMNFQKKGDTIYLLGDYHTKNDDNSSTVEILYEAVRMNLVSSAHPLFRSGLYCGLVEACSVNKLGFDITSDAEITDKEFLYNDRNSSILVSVNSENEGKFVDYIFNNSIRLTLLGHVTKGELRLDELSFGFIDQFFE
ncbi:MAG: hypothetical protein PHP30_03125 [Bacteroidales bacterium]|nr:hypothetical protein [Bacteroidales bacterium]MDD2424920.1 hypothetical protein [Bacteroidales bacterium]MDD3989072.1 hypothetical protein [Bacteroidales bacterium]MDD4638755.1 hypothetical protein [Bacteroidales bacterium]